MYGQSDLDPTPDVLLLTGGIIYSYAHGDRKVLNLLVDLQLAYKSGKGPLQR